jgi:hypothetical protein
MATNGNGHQPPQWVDAEQVVGALNRYTEHVLAPSIADVVREMRERLDQLESEVALLRAVRRPARNE